MDYPHTMTGDILLSNYSLIDSDLNVLMSSRTWVIVGRIVRTKLHLDCRHMTTLQPRGSTPTAQWGSTFRIQVELW